jgi:hypothetical protein
MCFGLYYGGGLRASLPSGRGGAVYHLLGSGYGVTCPAWWGPWWCFPLSHLVYLRGLGVRLRGKSFRWRRCGGVMVLRVGYAHAVAAMLAPPACIGYAGKNFIYVWGTSQVGLYAFAALLQSWREPNIYHGRGIRFSKQSLLRKSGKVSAYR